MRSAEVVPAPDEHPPAPAAYLIGIDGGGTRSTVAIADLEGREVARREGAAGIVDPRRPRAAVELLAAAARALVGDLGYQAPAEVVCAGLAGVGSRQEREDVTAALEAHGLARRVLVLSDGETALHDAFGTGPGILLVAGTGSVAYGRDERLRVQRCGGWGALLGDEGSGYWIGRRALTAALRGYDGRGEPTGLLELALRETGVSEPEGLPAWVAGAEKWRVAALAPAVSRLAAEGDRVAERILVRAAGALALHAAALRERQSPWSVPPTVALHGGAVRSPAFAARVRAALGALDPPLRVLDREVDAARGALALARERAPATQGSR